MPTTPPLSPLVLDRILAQLPPDDALVISAALEPPSRTRRRRLDQRDELIRAELHGLHGAALTLAAAALERRLERATWCSDQRDAVATDILRLSDGEPIGEPIGWYQLKRIATKSRTPG